MSRLVVPILSRVLYATGDVLLRAELAVMLKTNSGSWVTLDFLVDSGTEITTFPAQDAVKIGLPIPAKAARGAVHSQTGLEIRSGFLRFQIVGMDRTEYVATCFFLGDPSMTPTGPPGSSPRKLLQPLGLLKQLKFTFDDAPTLGAPYGEMVVEKK